MGFWFPITRTSPKTGTQGPGRYQTPIWAMAAGPAHIEQEDHRPPEFTELPGNVRGPGITAETVSGIPLAKDFKQNNGKIDGGGKVGQQTQY